MQNKHLRKVMKKYLLILLVSFTLGQGINAQVGIGVVVPNPKSILDMSNSIKFIQLPVSTVAPTSATLDTIGAVIYYNGNIYLRTPTGIKVFTPWKFNGSDVISNAASNPVGIGTTPVTNSNRLMVANASSPGVTSTSTATASIAVGNSSGNHLLIDNDEVMVKNNLTTPGILNFQREDGVVGVNMAASSTNATVLKANGSIDATQIGKIKENGNDLVPAGSIALWDQSVIPAGWVLCNGATYTRVDGGTIVAPDLRNRFVVGAGGDNSSVFGVSYPLNAVGGNNSSSHTHQIDPPSSTSSFGSAHTHGGTTGGSGSIDLGCCTYPVTVAGGNHTHTFTTYLGGSHSHEIDIPALPASGSSSVSENRPPYFALIYIMKL